MIRISKRKFEYEKICSSFEKEIKDTNYIYFAAPICPEGSSLPTALWNRHIKITILKLLSVMPDDWKIVYKVSQNSFLNMEEKLLLFLIGSSNFYYDLLKNRKSHFSSINTNTKDLIQNSIGVSSINGSVSIEAATLGKHAITFSPMWYDNVDGVHFCSTKKELEYVINLMKIKNIPDPNLINIQLSSESIFESNLGSNSFTKEMCGTISDKYISSYHIFETLGDQKWSI